MLIDIQHDDNSGGLGNERTELFIKIPSKTDNISINWYYMPSSIKLGIQVELAADTVRYSIIMINYRTNINLLPCDINPYEFTAALLATGIMIKNNKNVFEFLVLCFVMFFTICI